MIKVLFVDDEANLLAGLRRMLFGMNNEWEMTFAQSGSAALELMRTQAFDVIVTDMRMPEMDGMTLLSHVREEFPEVVRIILSGYSEMESMLRSIPVSHNFLRKPSPRETLTTAIERARELQKRLSDPQMRRVIGSITTLPSPSSTVDELNQLLRSENPSIDSITRIISNDIGMMVKVLQLVNSGFFGVSRTVVDIREAINYLGLSTIRDLLVTCEIFQNFESDGRDTEFITEIKNHSIRVGEYAGQLMSDERERNEAFVAGFLHDVGELIVGLYMPEKYAELCRRSGRKTAHGQTIEMEVLGTSHASIGAYLLELWGLPYVIVEAVARHHDAHELPDRNLDAVHAVYVAEAVTNKEDDDTATAIDARYLEDLGITSRVAELSASADSRSN